MLAPAESAPPGRTEFETLLELGRGGMGTAYLARALGSGGFQRLVVLKRLGAELVGNPEALNRFLSEARVAARLHHVNVVGTHEIGWDADGPFIVLDYVEGGSLDELVSAHAASGGGIPAAIVLRIALDVLAGLSAVHEATDAAGRGLDILHRDVSLQNVLVGVQDGVARVADFGVARSGLARSITEPGVFVGKLLYFSPEYLLREPVGPALDLYALGVTLWLALTGEELWADQGDGQVVRAIVDEGIPSLEGRVAVAPEIRELVARACARDPHARFQSAREMAAVIEELDRRAGWVARHAEVATCVEEMLGERLRHRREIVALRAPELGGDDRFESSLAYRATVRSPPPAAPAPKPTRRPTFARAHLALGATLLVSALLATWLLARDERPNDRIARDTGPALPITTIPPPPSVAPSTTLLVPAPLAESSPVAPALSAAPHAEASPVAAAPSAAPHAAAPPESPNRASSPRASPSVAPRVRPLAELPAPPLRRNNPYR